MTKEPQFVGADFNKTKPLSKSDTKLAEILLSQQVVSTSDIEKANSEAARVGISLHYALTSLNLCLEDEMNWAISRELGIPFVLLSSEMIDNEVASLFPLSLLQEVVAVPIRDAEGGVTIVMSDPLDEKGFAKLQEIFPGLLHLAVAPSGRVASVLDYLERIVTSSIRTLSKFETTDTGGVISVYSMIIDARSRGANRILIRPAGDGLEALFRLERGWVVYRLWNDERMISIATRCRIMMGVSPTNNLDHENAQIYARVNNERILILAEFFRDSSGGNIDLHLFPVISSPTLQEFKSMTNSHRNSLLNLVSARRPTGIILVNSPDQRQRYRMIYGLLAMYGQLNLDIISLEERKYLDSNHVRRFQVKNPSLEWDEIVHHDCDLLAVPDAYFWQWRELSVVAGKKLLIIGLDFANSWLAIKSFNEIIESQSIVADRLRAIWTGKRVDLTCMACGGRTDSQRGINKDGLCPACDGYGHSLGSDLFEVFVPDKQFRRELSDEKSISNLQAAFEKLLTVPTIQQQLEAGIETGVIFNALVYNE